jgi:hypothetical protein
MAGYRYIKGSDLLKEDCSLDLVRRLALGAVISTWDSSHKLTRVPMWTKVAASFHWGSEFEVDFHNGIIYQDIVDTTVAVLNHYFRVGKNWDRSKIGRRNMENVIETK